MILSFLKRKSKTLKALASNQAYIAVQNEIVKAINEIREDFCRANYGKAYENLTEEQQEIAREAVPQLISEAEPKDVSQK